LLAGLVTGLDAAGAHEKWFLEAGPLPANALHGPAYYAMAVVEIGVG
jgi:hypothetical protein